MIKIYQLYRWQPNLRWIKTHTIENIILSAGGVGPTPLLLDKTSKLLKDSNLRFNQNSLITALSHDISPISDLEGQQNIDRLQWLD